MRRLATPVRPSQPCGRLSSSTTRTQPSSARRSASARSRPSGHGRLVSERESSCRGEAERAIAAVAADESGDERVGRTRQQLGRGRELRERAADAQHGDRSPSLIASSMSCVTKTMVLPSSPCSRRNSSCSWLAHDRVDRAERLVHQHHRRIGRERSRHPDALLLSAGQLRRVALGQGVRQTRPARAAAWPAGEPRACPARAGAARSRCCRRPCGAGTARRAG